MRRKDIAGQGWHRTFEVRVSPAPGVKCASFGSKDGAHCKKSFRPIDWTVAFWTESKDVPYNIHNVKIRFGAFIANRLTIIRGRTKIEEYKHLKLADHPADL